MKTLNNGGNMDRQIETMYQYVVRKLNESKGRHSAIARDLGLDNKTLHLIATKKVESPNVHTVQKLHDYFRESAK